jgi:hypothetical protein
MGKKEYKLKPIRSGYFLVENELYNSDAWRAISRWSVQRVLLFFLHKTYRKKKNGKMIITNDGRIDATYRDIKEACQIKQNKTVNYALRELVEDLGFLKRTEVGSWDDRTPSYYGLDHRWRDYGTDKYIRLELTNIPNKWK